MEIALLALIPALVVTAAVLWILWKVLKGVFWLLGKLFRGIGAVLAGLFGFVKREIGETARVAGALVSGALLLPVAVLSAIFGRLEAARHFGRAIEDELVNVLLGIWRIGVAHPLRLVGLSGALEGVEGRIPDVFERAPRSAARARAGALGFPGYEVTGSLPGGGSGAQLFLARPVAAHPRAREIPGEVVIKSFALVQGSTLPQIVRESRALEAAGRLGLVLEHHLDEGRFWYVMRYVRGENLDTAVQRLHARSGVEGLGGAELALVLGYAQDLVRSLERFHAGGLWHKDVKPANLIVAGERAHLVDFGLVTPLASALTLTTHGTEYYRDPELVRLAMQGVKVHEVDGVKFDLYSAGAVLYTMVENSFPAHGSLSRLTKRCPEALTWILRRAMAEIGTRYASAREMLADLEALSSARDPFALAPADLPSVRGGPLPAVEPVASRPFEPEPLGAGAPARSLESAPAPRRRSRFCVDTTRPVTSGARRFRRFLVAAAVVLAGLALTRRFAEHRAYAEPATVLVPHVTRLEPEERRAYEVARKALRSAELEAPAAALALAWNERLARLAPGRAGARALVLESPVSPLESEERLALARALTAKGFAVLGASAEGAPFDSGDPVEPDELDLLGSARLAAGLGDPSDEEALARVQRYLEGARAIDALVWVASEPGAGTIVRVLERVDARESETAPVETARLSRRAR